MQGMHPDGRLGASVHFTPFSLNLKLLTNGKSINHIEKSDYRKDGFHIASVLKCWLGLSAPRWNPESRSFHTKLKCDGVKCPAAGGPARPVLPRRPLPLRFGWDTQVTGRSSSDSAALWGGICVLLSQAFLTPVTGIQSQLPVCGLYWGSRTGRASGTPGDSKETPTS